MHESKKIVDNCKFDDSSDPLKVEPDLGLPLELVGIHELVAGSDATHGAAETGVGSHYKMTNAIASNGGGLC